MASCTLGGMKTMILIDNGVTQLVLTPENEWETNALKCLSTANQTLETKWGCFYECQGGFMREGTRDDSLILRVLRP